MKRRPVAFAFALACACAACAPAPTYDIGGQRTEPAEPAPMPMRGRASYYGDALVGRVTASGERYDAEAMTAAHRTLPFGTYVRVVDPGTRRAVVVRINDRGPHVAGRTIDLSRRAARVLGIADDGVADVTIEVVAAPSRAP